MLRDEWGGGLKARWLLMDGGRGGAGGRQRREGTTDEGKNSGGERPGEMARGKSGKTERGGKKTLLRPSGHVTDIPLPSAVIVITLPPPPGVQSCSPLPASLTD